MKYTVQVKYDTNDGDYVTVETDITTDEELQMIKRVVEAVKQFKPYRSKGSSWNETHNWPVNEYSRGKSVEELYVETGLISKEDLEWFELELSHHDAHTMESVTLIPTQKKIKLL